MVLSCFWAFFLFKVLDLVWTNILFVESGNDSFDERETLSCCL